MTSAGPTCVVMAKPSSVIDLSASPAGRNNNIIIELDHDDDDDRKPAAKTQTIVEISSDDEEEDDDGFFPTIVSAPAAASLPRHAYAVSAQRTTTHHQQDLTLALELQKQEQEQFQLAKLAEEQEMLGNTAGIAWKFVEAVLGVLESNKATCGQDAAISPVAVDDMVYMTEKLLMAQDEFRTSIVNNNNQHMRTDVDIGYHYTRTENLERIRTDGLLSRKEREANNIQSNYNGSSFGDGVYVASNPWAYHNAYGDVGLMVARLRGVCQNYPAQFDGNTNTITARADTVQEFTVLEKSCQCVPLLQFSAQSIAAFMDDRPGNKAVFLHQVELQKLLDDVFNHGARTVVKPWNNPPTGFSSNSATMMNTGLNAIMASTAGLPPQIPLQSSGWGINGVIAGTTTITLPNPTGIPTITLPNPTGIPTAVTLPVPNPMHVPARRPKKRRRRNARPATPPTQETLCYEAPASMSPSTKGVFFKVHCSTHSILSEECAICLDALCHHGKVVRLCACGHYFHQSCIEDSLQHSPNCPTCRKLVGEPQGRMPSGTMQISRLATPCAGHSSQTIVIRYHIPNGVQKTYHTNPGQPHDAAHRTAYLPDTNEGRQLLLRLRYAFEHGLTFTVGTSLTTGRPNSVTWASIHHKTSLVGGAAHGFPDKSYLANCNRELDALHVPDGKDL